MLITKQLTVTMTLAGIVGTLTGTSIVFVGQHMASFALEAILLAFVQLDRINIVAE